MTHLNTGTGELISLIRVQTCPPQQLIQLLWNSSFTTNSRYGFHLRCILAMKEKKNRRFPTQLFFSYHLSFYFCISDLLQSTAGHLILALSKFTISWGIHEWLYTQILKGRKHSMSASPIGKAQGATNSWCEKRHNGMSVHDTRVLLPSNTLYAEHMNTWHSHTQIIDLELERPEKALKTVHFLEFFLF